MSIFSCFFSAAAAVLQVLFDTRLFSLFSIQGMLAFFLELEKSRQVGSFTIPTNTFFRRQRRLGEALLWILFSASRLLWHFFDDCDNTAIRD